MNKAGITILFIIEPTRILAVIKLPRSVVFLKNISIYYRPCPLGSTLDIFLFITI